MFLTRFEMMSGRRDLFYIFPIQFYLVGLLFYQMSLPGIKIIELTSMVSNNIAHGQMSPGGTTRDHM